MLLRQLQGLVQKITSTIVQLGGCSCTQQQLVMTAEVAAS